MSVTSRQQAKNTAGQKRGQPEPAQMPRNIQQQHLFTTAEIADLVDDLARHAEAVCRYYLSNGRRAGNHWLVGDKSNTPGRSLYMRLKSNGKGAAGKWADAATDEHGDLLDLIRETRQLRTFPEVVAEARRFLGRSQTVPQVVNSAVTSRRGENRRPVNNTTSSESSNEPSPNADAARRLFAASQPISGTMAELYLRRRGITQLAGIDALRFHARCYYRALSSDEDDNRRSDQSTANDDCGPPNADLQNLPALLAAITDGAGIITGVQRTYLDATALSAGGLLDDLLGKARVPSPRRALGDILGHGVHFGFGRSLTRPLSPHPGFDADVIAAGEGVETVLSLRMVLPGMPMIAALSASNLAALLFPANLRRLYIAQDDDTAGRHATAKLTARAEAAGIEVIVLTPLLDDFNSDLRRFGHRALCDHLRPQLAAEDVARFLVAAG
jgi:Toprim domain